MRAALIASTVVLLALAGGCGGDDDGDEDAFRAQVNAVCADYGPKLAFLQPPTESNEEWAAIGADMGDLLEASVNELRALEPPDSLSEGYARWVDLRASLLESIREVQTAGGQHDDPALEQALGDVEATMAEADPLAEELGFTDCSPTGITTSNG